MEIHPMKLATLCYIRRNNKTLMLLRNKKENDIHQGKWNGLGGKFNPGESPEECVTREVYEESGLVIKKPSLRGIMTFPDFSAGEDWYVFIFSASEFQGTLLNSGEGKLQWIDDNQILSLNLWEGDKIFLKWLEQDKFFSAKFIYETGDLKNFQVVFYDTIRKN
jgi:8-oxo-dGTP diphosphatase